MAGYRVTLLYLGRFSVGRKIKQLYISFFSNFNELFESSGNYGFPDPLAQSIPQAGASSLRARASRCPARRVAGRAREVVLMVDGNHRVLQRD